MLTLNDGRTELWQWDTGSKLTVDADCSQVHFSNKVFGRSIDVDVIDGVATIPDILLQTDKDLNVWAFVGTAENGYTKISKTFKVNRRNKPADYVFTPVEQTTLSKLEERLDKIEESQDPDAIKNAVEDYLEQNPVEAPVQSVNGQTGTVELTAEDVGAISQGDLQEATNEALAKAKASGEFDGAPGPAGAPGAPGDDYVLTDADRQEIAEIAAGLVEVPNVKPVAKTEDMTQPVGVDAEGWLWTAPTAGDSGGGFAEWELLGEYTLGTNISDKVAISFADYEQTDFILVADFPKTDGLSGKLTIKSSGSKIAAESTVSQHRHQGIAMLTKNPVDGYIYGNMAMSNGYTASMAPVFPSYRNLVGYKNMEVEMYPYEESEATGTVKIYGR